MSRIFGVPGVLLLLPIATLSQPPAPRDHIQVRGIYGGIPEGAEGGPALESLGVNAIWIGSGSLTPERVSSVRSQGARIFAEFNTLHVASFLEDHPEAAPIGPDGEVSPPPHGWQGICPNHEGYRRNRMEAFRRALADFEIDGIWLDYHHAHSSWERAEPVLPDTCFCPRCLSAFQEATGITPAGESVAEQAAALLSTHRESWVRWRCDVFTDWVREFREILDEVRPQALLGTFHSPWSDEDLDGARIEKLAIDLKAQARYIDVFSPMPYHARFGHASDPEWISRQLSWLGGYLGIEGRPEERLKIWPIVQLSDWGESVSPDEVARVLDYGTRLPATGVMVFAWGSLREHREKVEELGRFYRAIALPNRLH